MLELELLLKVVGGLLVANVALLAWIGRMVWGRLERMSERLVRVETAVVELTTRQRVEAEHAERFRVGN